MKLTQRQLNNISELLKEDVAERRDLHEKMYERRRTSLMLEDVSLDLADAVSRDPELEGIVSDAVGSFRTDLDKVLLKKLASLIAAAGGEKVSGPVLGDDLEDFDADGLMELQMELHSEIVDAVSKYMGQMALLASHAKLADRVDAEE